MPKGFSRSDVEIANDAPTRVSELLTLNGYAGSMVGAFLEIAAQNVADLVHGDSDNVGALNGRPIEDLYTRTAPPAVDPARIWLYSATGGTIGLTFESY